MDTRCTYQSDFSKLTEYRGWAIQTHILTAINSCIVMVRSSVLPDLQKAVIIGEVYQTLGIFFFRAFHWQVYAREKRLPKRRRKI